MKKYEIITMRTISAMMNCQPHEIPIEVKDKIDKINELIQKVKPQGFLNSTLVLASIIIDYYDNSTSNYLKRS